MDAAAPQIIATAAVASRAKAAPTARLVAVLVSLASAATLGLGAWITPDAAGHGSHTQLGLPPCAWAVVLHRPCPTCGMTTAVSHAAHGHFIRAFAAQPFGLLVALAMTAAFWSGLHVAAFGSHLGPLYARLMTPRVLWAIAAVAAGSWAYKWATWQA
jgi:hypothetical protein